MSRQQRGHTETGPRFKVSSERPEKRGMKLAIPGLVVWRIIHYSTAAPVPIIVSPYLELHKLSVRTQDRRHFLHFYM